LFFSISVLLTILSSELINFSIICESKLSNSAKRTEVSPINA
jgi:hypothetical protein